MRIIRTHSGKEVKIFAETFENEAYDQIKRLANYPAYENSIIRIMPDSHAGKGCTVGTTMTITDKVTPNLVGVDIGCWPGTNGPSGMPPATWKRWKAGINASLDRKSVV